MATITNLTSGIEVDFGGAVTYIKHNNVKLLKRGTNINIYDDSDDDGNQRGQVYITIPFSEVTSPVTADIDALSLNQSKQEILKDFAMSLMTRKT